MTHATPSLGSPWPATPPAHARIYLAALQHLAEAIEQLGANPETLDLGPSTHREAGLIHRLRSFVVRRHQRLQHRPDADPGTRIQWLDDNAGDLPGGWQSSVGHTATPRKAFPVFRRDAECEAILAGRLLELLHLADEMGVDFTVALALAEDWHQVEAETAALGL